MYTQCPECSSVFEISPEHLGAASGMVQCGVCNTTFNALRRLTELPPETAVPKPDGTDAPVVTKGYTSAEADSELQAQAGLFDEDPPSDGHLADTNGAPERRTIDDKATITADELSHSDDDTSAEDTSHSDETPSTEGTTTDEWAATDQNATDRQQAPARSPNNSDENIAESGLDVISEKVEATEEASPDDGNTDPSDFSEELAKAGPDDSVIDEDDLVEAGSDDSIAGEDDEVAHIASPRDSDPERSDHRDEDDHVATGPDDSIAGEDDEVADATSIDDRDTDRSKLNDNEDLAEAVPDGSITGENGTSEIDESDVDAAEEELNELLEDLDEDDDLIIVNPDDLFSTSQVLDEWDIEEGEHDLEAILADETLHDDEQPDEVPETRENAEENTESDTDSETWEEQHNSNESDSSEPEELADSDQLEDLEDLDELVEFDEEDLDDQDLIDDDQDTDDKEGFDDKDSHAIENNDDDGEDENEDVGDATDGDDDLIDQNQDTEAQDIDEHESPDDAQGTEVNESGEKTKRADRDEESDEGDEADTCSDSDEDAGEVASIGETDAEVEEPGETEPDSSAVLTEGVTGQFDDDDAEDLKDLGHYLSPKKSLARRLGEGSIVLVLTGLLLGQYVHHNRTELATHPTFGTHVRHAYSALGKDLRANWKVSDYRVARHTIVPNDDNADILMARATVVNNSSFERPLPLVRLQLKNRWGDPIYGRVFTPDEYIQGTAPETLAGNGKLEVSLDLIHPAPNEEIGYSFDVCLDTPAGPDCGSPQVFTE